jgi:hypothetical protein
MDYIEFLKNKMAISHNTGFDITDNELTPSLYPHVKDTVKWALKGGCRAIFSSFGMQKTVTQLEILRLVTVHKGGKALIVCPKRVVVEFMTQAKQHLNMPVAYVRTMQEVENAALDYDVMITNYERVRDGEDGIRINPAYFTATSLDEASCLRDYGSKTYQGFLQRFTPVPFRFVATATPSPNNYVEIIQYAGYLGIMDTGQAIQRFFKRDQTKVNNLTLYPHKTDEFWAWVGTWALFLTKPSDLGYPDDGYELPPLNVHQEVVAADNETAGYEADGQKKMFRDAAVGLKDAAKERRDSIPAKVERIVEILNRPENINDHFIIWHDLEAEREAICKAVKGCKAVYGSQPDDEADTVISDFKEGRLKYLAAKPVMLGEGLNFQYHCHKAIILVSYKFNDGVQAIARIHRFMQKYPVDLYIIYADSEQEIYKSFMQKWTNHKEMVERMTDMVRKNGLAGTDASQKLMRYFFSQRQEQKGQFWRAVNNDNVLECQTMPDNSVGLIVTSIPFSNQYEYTPSYNDFGHNEDNAKFFEQMDYLTPELLRILQPGRILACHVKDRVVSGFVSGAGFQTVIPFSDMTVLHYLKHGFQYGGRITIDTDVVQENNKSYRLGYTEMCKDGSKMSVGCPEYILLFRKIPTDRSNAYADVPVTKNKSDYSLARWQIDAHADWKSSGDRLLSYEDVKSMPLEGIRAFYNKYSKEHLYNYWQHVAFAEGLEQAKRLSKQDMIVAPASHREDIWDLSDYQRAKTLNSKQSRAKKTVHICPLPIDLVTRCIERWSNKGDVVFDPFGGIQTVPYCAVKLGRKGLSTELNPEYWHDGLTYLREAETEVSSPTLFDLMDAI